MKRKRHIKGAWVWWLAFAVGLAASVVMVGGFIWRVFH